MDPSITLPLDENRATLRERQRTARIDALLARLRFAALVLALLALMVLGAEKLTSSPALCGSCHEMQLRTEAWKVSPHATVKCVSCHVSEHAWYAYPQALLGRGQLLSRVFVKHFSGGGGSGPVDSRPAGIAPMPDSRCLQCHDPKRKPTSGLGIKIDHPKHAKRNGSCVSCHVTVAHPLASRGTELSFMSQCFTCHGSAKGAKAPGTCTLCHPAGFEQKPKSHKAASQWRKGHGKVAVTDRRMCEMCHARSFCDSCHGIAMPHPQAWGTRAGHPASAKRDREVCTRCHGRKRDWCTMCHHKAYDPSQGAWVKQHFVEVKAKGAARCLESCHSPVFCSRCHVGNPAPDS